MKRKITYNQIFDAEPPPARYDIDYLLEEAYNRIFTEEGKKLVGPFRRRNKK